MSRLTQDTPVPTLGPRMEEAAGRVELKLLVGIFLVVELPILILSVLLG